MALLPEKWADSRWEDGSAPGLDPLRVDAGSGDMTKVEYTMRRGRADRRVELHILASLARPHHSPDSLIRRTTRVGVALPY